VKALRCLQFPESHEPEDTEEGKHSVTEAHLLNCSFLLLMLVKQGALRTLYDGSSDTAVVLSGTGSK
jgi:hypothetical protein